MAMGEHNAVYAISIFPKIRQIRENQIYSRHVGFREHQAHINHNDSSLDFEAGTISTDLAKATKEDNPDVAPSFSHEQGRAVQRESPLVHRVRCH